MHLWGDDLPGLGMSTHCDLPRHPCRPPSAPAPHLSQLPTHASPPSTPAPHPRQSQEGGCGAHTRGLGAQRSSGLSQAMAPAWGPRTREKHVAVASGSQVLASPVQAPPTHTLTPGHLLRGLC